MDIEFAKTLHFRELDRRAEIDNAASSRAAVLALLAGVFAYYFDRLRVEPVVAFAVFIAASAAAAACAAVAIYKIIRIHTGFEWSYLAAPRSLLQHYHALEQYRQDEGVERSAKELFEEQLLALLVEAATENGHLNNSRSARIYEATRFVIATGVSTVLAGLPIMYQALSETLQSS